MHIPLIEDLTKEPVPPGSSLLVEFDAASHWYAALATIAAGWLRTGGRVNYFIVGQSPDKVRNQLRRLGMNLEELEATDRLLINDWYTVTLGQKSKEKYAIDSLKVADMSIWISKQVMHTAEVPDSLRITDNVSQVARFNDEKAWVEYALSRMIPASAMRKETAIRGIIRGIHSDWAYRNLEAAVDGIIDFKLEESSEEPRNLIRIRSMRTVGFDGRWHPLKIGENFEITIDK